jgi:hypothetical protein
MDLKEERCSDGDWIHWTKDNVQWRAFVGTEIKRWLPQEKESGGPAE